MADDKDLDDALAALARSEGKSKEDLLREMVGDRILARRGGSEMTTAERRRLAERDHHAQAFPQTPVVRYEGDDYGETPEEAKERWLAEEAELIDGVHGVGGQTAGGIFGEGAIATSVYDPHATGRATMLASHAANGRLAGVLERLEARLSASEARARGALPPSEGRLLPRARKR